MTTSPIAATTFQGRTVLAFRSYNSGWRSNIDNGHIILLTQIENPATATNPLPSLSWASFDTNVSDVNGVGLASDQSLLYLTSSQGYGSLYPTSLIWSLAPATDGSWTMGSQQTVAGSPGLANGYAGNNYATLIPFLVDGRLMATWSGTNDGIQVAELTTTVSSATHRSLAGFSIDGQIDVNGDGFADIMISDPSNPSLGINNQYVLFGGDYLTIASQVGTPGNDTLVGTTLADEIDTLSGSDVVQSRGGADVISTGSGDDQISIVDNAFLRIDAGSGFDRLQLEGLLDQDYNFSLFSPSQNPSACHVYVGTKLRDFELIDSQDYGANSLQFDLAAINAFNDDRILFVIPDLQDDIALTSEFQRSSAFDTSFAGSYWAAYVASTQASGTRNPALVYVGIPVGTTPSWLDQHVTTLLSAGSSVLSPDPVTPTLRSAAFSSMDLTTDPPVLISPLVGSSVPATAPEPSEIHSSSGFGQGLTISAYRSTPESGVARYRISRTDTSVPQVVTYVSSSLSSSAEPGLHYTPVAGLLRLEIGQASADITVPVDALAIKELRTGTLSLKVQELQDLHQRPFHLLLGGEANEQGVRPVLSGLDLHLDASQKYASIVFRADTTRLAAQNATASSSFLITHKPPRP